MKRFLAFVLSAVLLVQVLTPCVANAADNYEISQITVFADKNGDVTCEKPLVIKTNDELYINAEDIPCITRFSYGADKDKIAFILGMKFVTIDYSGNLEVNFVPQQFSGFINYENKYFIPLSEILPWLNVSWEVNNGCLWLYSDPCSIWEMKKDFSFSDYSFDWTDYTSSIYDSISYGMMATFDALLNLDDLWKHASGLVYKGQIDTSNTYYAYETICDTLTEFAMPEAGTDAEVESKFNALSKIVSPVSKLGGTGQDIIQELDESEYGKELAEIMESYDSEYQVLSFLKTSGKVLKTAKTGLKYIRLLINDTVDYGKAIEWIYLRDVAKSNDAEIAAAIKTSQLLQENSVKVMDAVISAEKKCAKDLIKELSSETVKDTAFKAITQYTDIVDGTLSLLWPINKAYSEMSKLTTYNQLQSQAQLAYHDVFSQTDYSAENLRNASLSAIIAMKAGIKCYEAYDKTYACFGGAGILQGEIDKLNGQIMLFELCLDAAEHDAIYDRSSEVEEVHSVEKQLKVVPSVAEFCKKIEGIWVDMDSCTYFGQSAFFDYMAFSNGDTYTATTNTDVGSPIGKIMAVSDLGNGEYCMTVHYPETDSLLGHTKEYTVERYIRLEGDHMYGTGDNHWECVYMGKNLENARQNATKQYYKDKINQYSTSYDAYNEKITEYIYAILRDFANLNEERGFDNSSINNYMVADCHSDDEMIGYALYDIDENGTPELLFRNEFGGIIDAYTLTKDGGIVKLFENCSFGDLQTLEVLNNSCFLAIENYSSNSMNYKLFQFKNEELIDIEAYYYDNTGKNTAMDKNYAYVSKAEWYKLCDPLYTKSVTDNLEWIMIR